MSGLVVHDAVSDGASLVLALEGELDIETEYALTALVSSAFESGVTKLILDMSRVSFVDSSGLTALVTGLKAAQEADATLVLRKAPRQLRDLLVITSLDSLFAVES